MKKHLMLIALRGRQALPITIIFISLMGFFLHGNVFASSSFYDVTDDTLYSPYIQKLYDAHLITGDTDNGEETYRYRPKDSLTRAEFTKVAVGIKLAEKYGVKEDWQSKSAYEITETVLKGKLLYFHGCSNADLPNCTSLCGADICGVCNVCQLTNEKPFTDVAVKSRDCEEQGVCTPWYSEYIYYAQRKGMVWGYREGTSYRFEPDAPILRIHALKLVMADSGAVDPEADERYRRLSQTAKSRGSYYPKCLSGAENLILKNNGGAGSGDGEKLLKYALLADKLDFFGNSCQVFSEAGARTPEARAKFLNGTLTRQEVARYFVLSSSYSPLRISAEEDPTVEEAVSLLTDMDAPAKEVTPSSQLPAPNSADPTLKVYAENIPIQTNPFESTYNRSVCIKSLSVPRLCKDASMSNCITVADGTRIKTTDEELYGRTPAGYYTWLWHGVVYNGKNYYVATDDLDFNCTTAVKAPIVKNTVKLASAPVAETSATKVKKVSYPSPDCGVIMSCEPIITYETVNETKTISDTAVILKNSNCGVTMSCNPAPQKEEPSDNGDWIVNNPVTNFVMDTGGWITENVGKPVGEAARNYVVEPVTKAADKAAKDTVKVAKHAWFFVNQPQIALRIGTVEDGDNISSSVSRFSIGSRLLENEDYEGSQRNAFRHALWQAEITKEFGKDVAKDAGSAHEISLDNGKINDVEFKELIEADESADLRNNVIGREIGSLHSDKTIKELALTTLEYFKDHGLWTAEKKADGTYTVKLEKITQESYENATKLVKELDENGRLKPIDLLQ